jgi:ribonuclease HI
MSSNSEITLADAKMTAYNWLNDHRDEIIDDLAARIMSVQVVTDGRPFGLSPAGYRPNGTHPSQCGDQALIAYACEPTPPPADVLNVYTDGACSGNPGPGGWAFATSTADVHSGAETYSTNNRMELTAVIMALEHYLPTHEGRINIYSDSDYVINSATKWVAGWKSKGWRLAKGGPVKNVELWRRFDALNCPRICFVHVPAHSNDPLNTLVNDIAQERAGTRHRF